MVEFDVLRRALDERGVLVVDAMTLGEEMGMGPDDWHDAQKFANALSRHVAMFACTVERGPEYFQMTIRAMRSNAS